MVSHSHLSAGNSLSSVSRDFFAEFGVSNPNSPSLSSPLVLSSADMAVSADLSLNVDSFAMLESDPNPVAVDQSSEDSTSLANEIESNLGQALTSNVSEIFKAAQHFSQKDREDVLIERKKNADLMDCLLAHGLSASDINAFVSDGKLANIGQAHKMSIGSTQKTSAALLLAPCSVSGQSILGKPLDPIPSAIAAIKPAASPVEQGENPLLNPGPPKSWCEVVSTSSGKPSRSLSYHPPLSEDGPILVKPPTDVLKRGNQLWSSSLVGYFLHSNIPFKVVEPIAKRLWGNMGLTSVFLHSKGYYIFKFKSVSARDNVLASGPWHFASKVIVLQPWKEGVEFSKSDQLKIPIWVKLSQIPLSYWSDEGISYLASAIGRPLFTDEMTSKHDLMQFARVCIEVQASFSFPSSINVVVLNEETSEDIIVPVSVEYQSRPPSCPSCKVFGHSPLKCPKSNFKWVPRTNAQPESAPKPADGTSAPGPLLPTPAPDAVKNPHAGTHANDWVTVSRGAKVGNNPTPSLPILASPNSFSPIANAIVSDALSPSDLDSPPINCPILNKLIAIDEKEGKDLKHKQRSGLDPSQDAKRRNKGKGRGGKTSC